jgi:hypothetical protein
MLFTKRLDFVSGRFASTRRSEKQTNSSVTLVNNIRIAADLLIHCVGGVGSRFF